MLIIPWNESIDITASLNVILVIFLVSSAFIAVTGNFDLIKKPRFILHWMPIYMNIIIGISLIIMFYWYIALPLNYLIARAIYTPMINDFEEYMESERLGGSSLIKKYREIQKQAFMLKSREEQEAHVAWCNEHPIVISKKSYYLASLLPPILTIVAFVILRIGYRLW